MYILQRPDNVHNGVTLITNYQCCSHQFTSIEPSQYQKNKKAVHLCMYVSNHTIHNMNDKRLCSEINKSAVCVCHKRKQEEQMLIQSIFAILTGLLHGHLPYKINHHQHLSSFMQLYNRRTAQILACR